MSYFQYIRNFEQQREKPDREQVLAEIPWAGSSDPLPSTLDTCISPHSLFLQLPLLYHIKLGLDNPKSPTTQVM